MRVVTSSSESIANLVQKQDSWLYQITPPIPMNPTTSVHPLTFSSAHPVVEAKEHRDHPLFQGLLGDELDRLFAHPLNLLVEPLDRVVGVDLPPQRFGEFAESEEIAQGIGPFGGGSVFGAPLSLEFGERLLRLFLARAPGQRHEEPEAASFLSDGQTLEQRFLIRRRKRLCLLALGNEAPTAPSRPAKSSR